MSPAAARTATGQTATPPGIPTREQYSFRAMASEIRLWVVSPASTAPSAMQRAEEVFRRIEAACTRFDPASPLMRANDAGDTWHAVPRECVEAVAEAARAHAVTAGMFDPRVLRTLRANGYDRSLPFAAGPVSVAESSQRQARAGTGPAQAWEPGIDAQNLQIKIGAEPIDLGGIGKGIAVRRAAQELRDAGQACLVEAGGDCYAGGSGPEGAGWRLAVEDPFGGQEPVAVLSISDLGCATSSIRLRQWQVGQRRVHHLIDPRTGEPGGAGLQAVTVVGPDPALAEVWSKTLFLAGRRGIADLARSRGLAALWVTEHGQVRLSAPMREFVIWERVND